MPQGNSPVQAVAPGPSSTLRPASGSPTPPSPPTTTAQLVRFSWRSVPGGAITEHIDLHQEERFTSLAVEAHFTLGGERLVAKAGETIVVPACLSPDSQGNPGAGEIEGIVELRPALLAKEFHEALAGRAADGKTTPRGAPRNPLQLGATFWHFRRESRVTSPPIAVQNLMLPPLWALAKAFGVRPYHHHDGRTAGAEQPTQGPLRACKSAVLHWNYLSLSGSAGGTQNRSVCALCRRRMRFQLR